MIDYTSFEKKINYKFSDLALLKEATCHSSYANERRDENVKCSERLEFLGDSVLSMIVSEFLFTEYPDYEEGVLSRLRREAVDSISLAGFARKIGLGDVLLLGHGEEQLGGRDRQSNLEDAFEALVAAIYLDGGIDAARAFVLPFAKATAEETLSRHKLNDPKTKLQEIVQTGGAVSPRYVITGESGPDHKKHFECDVLVENNVMGHGAGPSKKEAEKAAAEDALKKYFPDD